MPKGSGLSIYFQDELDAIALSLNTRPRARLSSDSCATSCSDAKKHISNHEAAVLAKKSVAEKIFNL